MESKKARVRGSRPDAEIGTTFILIKRSSELRATYQIRLLLYRAVQEGKLLLLEIGSDCRIHPTLQELLTKYPKNIKITRE
jgi:hypothetical protein